MTEIIKLMALAALTCLAGELLNIAAARLQLVGVDAEFRTLTSGKANN